MTTTAKSLTGEDIDRMSGLLERMRVLADEGNPARARKEHEALLDALKASDEAEAARVVAVHLARTALSVPADVAPEYEPVATRAALGIAGGGQA